MAEIKLTQQAHEMIALLLADKYQYLPKIEIIILYSSNVKLNFTLTAKYFTHGEHGEPVVPYWGLKTSMGKIFIEDVTGPIEELGKFDKIQFGMQRDYKAQQLANLADQIRVDGFSLILTLQNKLVDNPRFSTEDIKSIKVLV